MQLAPKTGLFVSTKVIEDNLNNVRCFGIETFCNYWENGDFLGGSKALYPVRIVIREKNGIMWEKLPSGGPPPSLGNHCYQKNKLAKLRRHASRVHFAKILFR